ncbi:hypothetical protein HBI17_167490 [Parastagonospora nodorum]|nr:hypothetical protein HBI45_194940 [Parastagonospora nodorum]KAH5741861.1 hypothetical protein HBI17_167490 [Parastagonospora nodorum]KAH5998036.1 hypothetical protein HBI84_113800 [Parastagonospora nodorum]KAH6153686.1 hypothetical protein HBI68_160250 [Parastagonospora nodorum]KAH6418247.1 hypothetical protein HBI14_099840 [Parastagonospora nodorum]
MSFSRTRDLGNVFVDTISTSDNRVCVFAVLNVESFCQGIGVHGGVGAVSVVIEALINNPPGNLYGTNDSHYDPSISWHQPDCYVMDGKDARATLV